MKQASVPMGTYRQLILQMIAMEIDLTITVTYLQLEARIMHYRNLSEQIFGQ